MRHAHREEVLCERQRREDQYEMDMHLAKAICVVCDGLQYSFTPVMSRFKNNKASHSFAKDLLAEFSSGRLRGCQNSVLKLLKEMNPCLRGEAKRVGQDLLLAGFKLF